MSSDTMGFAAVAVAMFFFGTNFIPVKRFDAGDGMFFQWVMCAAIFFVGCIVNFVRNTPEFHALAMLGGVLWCTGNVLCVPVINAIGMGLGLLLWGISNLLMGWASGHFGLFGLKKQTGIAYPTLNIVGLLVAVASLGMFFFVKVDVRVAESGGVADHSHTHSLYLAIGDGEDGDDDDDDDERHAKLVSNENTPLYAPQSDGQISVSLHGNGTGKRPSQRSRSVRIPTSESDSDHSDDDKRAAHRQQKRKIYRHRVARPGRRRSSMRMSSGLSDQFSAPGTPGAAGEKMFDEMTQHQRRMFGFALAIVAGCFFGVNFDPPQYIIDHATPENGHSKNGLDYVFAHFTGLFLASTAYFLAYCAYKKNAPWINPHIILPGFASGVMWAVAEVAWFVANEKLSFVVSFPMITTGPGVIASLWGVFLFHEIRGRRNYMWLSAAFMATITGVVLITLSKVL